MSDSDLPSAVDLVVIGAGPGGYVAAIRAGQLGLDVLVVERAEPGGVCLNHGCIPSKALIKAASTAHDVADSAWLSGDVDVDFAGIGAWKDGVVDRLTGGVEALCDGNGVTLVEGTATFVDESAVSVNPSDLTEPAVDVAFENAVVATGSRPIEVPGFEFDDDSVLSSRDALALETVPDRLVVVGAGYIGMELSTAFAKLGTDVQVVEMLDRPLPAYEDDLASVVQSHAKGLGVEFAFGESAAEWYQDIAGDVVVATETKDGDRSEYASDAVLVAVGRQPVTDTVNASTAGLEPNDAGFFETDEFCRTDVDGVYAVGDVAGEPMLAHKGSHEGVIAAEHAAGADPAPATESIPTVVFTEPEIATVGATAAEARADGHAVATGRISFDANGRALTTGHADGFVRVVVDADSGVFLGAQVVGPHASELVGELALAVTAGIEAPTVARTVHAHPTLGEAVMEAAANADGEAIHTLNR